MSRARSTGWKKIYGGKDAAALLVPSGLLRIGEAACFGVLTSPELPLPMLSADPHDVAPAGRIRDQADYLVRTAVNAAAALERAAAKRHGQLGAR